MTSVQVAVRVRPFNAREISFKSVNIIHMDQNICEVYAVRGGEVVTDNARKFTFDHCFWTHDQVSVAPERFASQLFVYENIGKNILQNLIEGYNSCLFAYGQTGSGKTYSMMGIASDRGVIPRVCQDLFDIVEKKKDSHRFQIECEYLEIYNETVRDLLDPSFGSLRVRQHPKIGVFIEGITRMNVKTEQEVMKLIEDGALVRHVAATKLNEQSSRSHAILTLRVRQSSRDGERYSCLNLVDLAGSERASSTGATGSVLQEGSNINRSLTVLGICLSRLAEQSEGKKKHHVPYRDSQLTWILNESLGGNSKTAMLANISPADINTEETLSTLRFAATTKKIKNNAVVNEDPIKKLIRELRTEIDVLRSELMQWEAGETPDTMNRDQEPSGDAEDSNGGTSESSDACEEENEEELEEEEEEEEERTNPYFDPSASRVRVTENGDTVTNQDTDQFNISNELQNFNLFPMTAHTMNEIEAPDEGTDFDSEALICDDEMISLNAIADSPRAVSTPVGGNATRAKFSEIDLKTRERKGSQELLPDTSGELLSSLEGSLNQMLKVNVRTRKKSKQKRKHASDTATKHSPRAKSREEILAQLAEDSRILDELLSAEMPDVQATEERNRKREHAMTKFRDVMFDTSLPHLVTLNPDFNKFRGVGFIYAIKEGTNLLGSYHPTNNTHINHDVPDSLLNNTHNMSFTFSNFDTTAREDSLSTACIPEINFPANLRIVPHHCNIHYDALRQIVTMAPLDGTYCVNGDVPKRPIELKHNDRIILGKLVFRFTYPQSILSNGDIDNSFVLHVRLVNADHISRLEAFDRLHIEHEHEQSECKLSQSFLSALSVVASDSDTLRIAQHETLASKERSVKERHFYLAELREALVAEFPSTSPISLRQNLKVEGERVEQENDNAVPPFEGSEPIQAPTTSQNSQTDKPVVSEQDDFEYALWERQQVIAMQAELVAKNRQKDTEEETIRRLRAKIEEQRLRNQTIQADQETRIGLHSKHIDPSAVLVVAGKIRKFEKCIKKSEAITRSLVATEQYERLVRESSVWKPDGPEIAGDSVFWRRIFEDNQMTLETIRGMGPTFQVMIEKLGAKKVAFFGGWKRRWACVINRFLVYFEASAELSSRCIGGVYLYGATISSIPGRYEGRENCIGISPTVPRRPNMSNANEEEQRLIFCLESPAARDRCLSVLLTHALPQHGALDENNFS